MAARRRKKGAKRHSTKRAKSPLKSLKRMTSHKCLKKLATPQLKAVGKALGDGAFTAHKVLSER